MSISDVDRQALTKLICACTPRYLHNYCPHTYMCAHQRFALSTSLLPIIAHGHIRVCTVRHVRIPDLKRYRYVTWSVKACHLLKI